MSCLSIFRYQMSYETNRTKANIFCQRYLHLFFFSSGVGSVKNCSRNGNGSLSVHLSRLQETH